MKNNYKLLLIIPLLIIALATYLLLSGEAYLQKTYVPNTNSAASRGKDQNIAKALGDELQSNRESAYSYFLLGAGLLVALLVLPRLAEITFSPTNGFTLKVLQEVKEALSEAKTTTQAIEQKTRQAILPDAQKSLLATQTDLSPELTKLNESTARLNAYADLLEKLMEKKSRK